MKLRKYNYVLLFNIHIPLSSGILSFTESTYLLFRVHIQRNIDHIPKLLTPNTRSTRLVT
ncbi:hypothetical protein Hanom_Chr09g00813441 [Helianthus anomalus]